ncbi:hypothetical protein TgHK011_009584 [Trichoderma gracile]|nr:hypothetical protein TgHK011_009584 [Trichoderma gracile]
MNTYSHSKDTYWIPAIKTTDTDSHPPKPAAAVSRRKDWMELASPASDSTSMRRIATLTEKPRIIAAAA